MKKLNLTTIFDWIVIILEICYGISMLMHVFYLIPAIGMLLPLTSFMVICQLIRFGTKVRIISFAFKNPILAIFFFILILDVIQTTLIYDNYGVIGISLARLTNSFFFLNYLYCLYLEKKDLNYIRRPYICYSIYNILAILLLVVLIILGFGWQNNLLPNDLPLLLGHNEYTQHYFPYFISLASDFHEYQLFGSLPGITGLSHEPHVIMWILTPAIIMILGYKIKAKFKILLLLIYLFLLAETFSTTAIISFVIIFILQVCWMSLSSQKNIYLIMTIIILVTIFPFIINMDLISAVVTSKSKGSSAEYSTNMLSYITSFNDIVGYGNLPPTAGKYDTSINVGLLTGVSDIFMYITLLIASIKLYIRNEENLHYFGLGFLYYLIHGLKVNYLVFGYPYFAYMIFVLCLFNRERMKKAMCRKGLN